MRALIIALALGALAVPAQAADSFAIYPFDGDVSHAVMGLDQDIYILMMGSCRDPGHQAEVRALDARYQKLRADFFARSGLPASTPGEILTIEGDTCFRADQFDANAWKVRRKLNAARRALDRQFPP